jgi:hypothetical protein
MIDKPADLPQDIWDAACAVERWWTRDGQSISMRTLLRDGISRAILAERERCAKAIDDECARILSKQDGKDDSVDRALRLVAVMLPELSATIRKGVPDELQRPGIKWTNIKPVAR